MFLSMNITDLLCAALDVYVGNRGEAQNPEGSDKNKNIPIFNHQCHFKRISYIVSSEINFIIRNLSFLCGTL